MIFDRLARLFSGAPPAPPAEWAISYAPSFAVPASAELAIVSPAAEVRGDLSRCHAYLSFTEIPAHEAVARGLPREAIFGRNPRWDSYLVDITRPEWGEALLAEARAAVARGFHHLFLDTVDGIDLLIDSEPVRLHPVYQRALELFHLVESEVPGRIIMNRGFTLYPEVKDHLAGLLIESYFYKLEGDRWVPRPRREMAWLAERVATARGDGKFLLALDYAPLTPEEEEGCRARARAEGVAWMSRDEDLQ